MKTPCLILCVALLSTFVASGQGFIYDQSSATDPAAGGGGAAIFSVQPMGQSFTPTLTAIDFVQFNFTDANPGNGLGATLFVNLWSGSISNGTLLSATDPIFLPNAASRLVTTFLFPTSVTLAPGTTYYLQLYPQSGDASMAAIDSLSFNYSGGTFYFNGAPDPNNQDLWFREGIVAVPEPSSSLLILLGSGFFLFARHKRIKRSPF